MSSIEERVKKIVVEQLGVKEEEVTANASFVDDLGADSLDTVELVMALEEEFECEIPDEDAEGEALEDIILDAVDGTLDSIPPRRRRDVEMVREAVRRSVRSAVDRAWGKRPIVKVLLKVVRVKI